MGRPCAAGSRSRAHNLAVSSSIAEPTADVDIRATHGTMFLSHTLEQCDLRWAHLGFENLPATLLTVHLIEQLDTHLILLLALQHQLKQP
jgi:hypothetical protein